MQEKILQILIEGSTTSIAIITLAILYKILTNDLRHLHDVMVKLEKTLVKLEQLLEDRLK